ncbi:MAG: 16S rRNA processing protein RimM [Deltaproteobacteria bacterium]|nr:16S rRNA processing protein RimM [Deltaproteobacteria bacterium]
MTYDRTRFLAIGLVTRPHGVSGEVRLRLHHAESTALEEVEAVWLALPGATGEPRRYVVEGARYVAGGVLCELEGVADRDQAALLRGAEVCVPRAELPPLADGEFYLGDLEGCAVVTRAGQPFGVVHQVQELGAHDTLVIHDGEVERLLPYVPQFVVDVDLEARRVVVDPPEGLPEARLKRR